MEESTRISSEKQKPDKSRRRSRKSTKKRRTSEKSREPRKRNYLRKSAHRRETKKFRVAIQECPNLLQKKCSCQKL